MFPKIKLARSLKLRVGAVEGLIGFEGTVGHSAATHHYSKEDFVGRAPSGQTIRSNQRERVLLGFGSSDLEEITGAAMAWLNRCNRNQRNSRLWCNRLAEGAFIGLGP